MSIQIDPVHRNKTPLFFHHLSEIHSAPLRDVTDRRDFLTHHGRFATACGLALQGLGQVPFTVDLLPKEKPSFLSRVKDKFRKRQPSAAWGFDFGNSCFKAVRVAYDQNGLLVVDECFHCYHPYDLPKRTPEEEAAIPLTDFQVRKMLEEKEQPGNPFDREESPYVSTACDQAQFKNLAIEAFLAKYEYRGEAICIGYPAHDILCANIQLPQMPPNQTHAAVQYESGRHLPNNSSLYTHNYLVLGWEEDEQNIAKQYVHLFATRWSTIQNELQVLEKYGISPTGMTSNVLANLNYAWLLLTQPPAEQTLREETNVDQSPEEFTPPDVTSILICDMGTLGTDLTFYSLREIKHFYIDIGGQHFSEAIAEALNESFSFGEAVKRHPKRTDRQDKVVEAVKPVARRLAHEVTLRLEHFRKHGGVLDQIVVLGGGFQLRGFATYFKNLLNAMWVNGR